MLVFHIFQIFVKIISKLIPYKILWTLLDSAELFYDKFCHYSSFTTIK